MFANITNKYRYYSLNWDYVMHIMPNSQQFMDEIYKNYCCMKQHLRLTVVLNSVPENFVLRTAIQTSAVQFSI